MIDPYEHAHSGVDEISWSRLGDIMVSLAEKISAEWRPEVVVGIAKGGVVPGIFLSSAFMVDFYPVKLSSRHDEQVVSAMPMWYVRPTAAVKDKKVLLVDDICVAGRTLGMAISELQALGAAEIRTAAIAAHQESVRPDYVGIVTDACVVLPWDKNVLSKDGRWEMNIDYAEELETHVKKKIGF